MKNSRPPGFRLLTRLLCAMALTLGLGLAAQAQDNGHVCIPQLGTNPALPNIFPLVDGTIEDFPDAAQPSGLKTDPGWNGAAKLNMNDTTSGTTRTARLLLGKNATEVFLGLMIESPIGADANDTVLIGLATKAGDPATDWRIRITPFNVASAATMTFENMSPVGARFLRGNLGGTWTAVTSGDGTWLDPTLNNIKVSKSNSSWYLEIRIPRENLQSNAGSNSTIYFPTGSVDPADNFRIYVNVLSTKLFPTGATVFQNPWPTWNHNTRLTGVSMAPFDVEFQFPPQDDTSLGTDPRVWGTGSLFSRSDCTGISLDVNQVGSATNPTSPSTSTLDGNIRAFDPSPNAFPSVASCQTIDDNNNTLPTFSQNGPLNVLVARPVNTMPSVTPSNMTVKFRLADWGIPGIIFAPNDPRMGDWQPVTGRLAGANPTNGPTMPPAGGASTGQFHLDWRLTFKQSCIFRQVNFAHQCMLAEMDSTDLNVRFLNRSVAVNMDFVPASRFARDARISAHGYGDPPLGRSSQKFLIVVDQEIQDYRRPNPTRLKSTATANALPMDAIHQPRLDSDMIRRMAPSHFPKGLSEALVWIARGFRLTGRFIEINGVKYEYAESVGGFGYVVGHKGDVASWERSFSGGGLTNAGENAYALDIPPEGVATVNTTIEAVEPQTTSGFKRWGLSLHAGVSFPHGNFNTAYNPGSNAGIDLEYRINRHFSLEGIYTFHRFRGQRFDLFRVPDLNVHQFSINGKVYGSSSPLRPFFNFGAGAYKFDPGSTRGGLNVGFGVQRDITPTFAIEAMYNFHNVFTPGSSTRFSTVQGGVRFRF